MEIARWTLPFHEGTMSLEVGMRLPFIEREGGDGDATSLPDPQIATGSETISLGPGVLVR